MDHEKNNEFPYISTNYCLLLIITIIGVILLIVLGDFQKQLVIKDKLKYCLKMTKLLIIHDIAYANAYSVSVYMLIHF